MLFTIYLCVESHTNSIQNGKDPRRILWAWTVHVYRDPPVGHIAVKGLNLFRVCYQLQMIETISTIFVTEQPHRNLPFLVFSATQSTGTRETNRSPRNYRTLPAIISPFVATLFLTQQNSS